MKDKILILGRGYIGLRLKEELQCAISDKKIYSYKDAEEEIKKHRPQVLINCIGFTGGNNVDDCESDKDKTIFANAFVPVILAEAALRSRVRLVHISTGCIYHYDYSKGTPIDETREPDFYELFYSRTKVYSDKALLFLARKYPILIARVRVPLDNRPHPRNLLTKLIKFRKIINLPNSVTYLPDFARALTHLIKIEANGIYNVVNRGPLVYSRLLEAYKRHMPDFSYEVIDFKKLNLVRTNLILSTKKLEDAGFNIRAVDEVLEECVSEYLRY